MLSGDDGECWDSSLRSCGEVWILSQVHSLSMGMQKASGSPPESVASECDDGVLGGQLEPRFMPCLCPVLVT